MEDFSNMIPCEICSQHVLFDQYAVHVSLCQSQQMNINPSMNSLAQLFQHFQNPVYNEIDDTSDDEDYHEEMEVEGVPIEQGQEQNQYGDVGNSFQDFFNSFFENIISTHVSRANIPENTNLPLPEGDNLELPITQEDKESSLREFNSFQELSDFLTHEGFELPRDPYPNQNAPPGIKFKFNLISYTRCHIQLIQRAVQVQPQTQPQPQPQPQPQLFLFEFYHPPPIQNLEQFNIAFPPNAQQTNAQQSNVRNLFQQLFSGFNLFPQQAGGNVAANYDYFMNLAEQLGNVEIGIRDIEKVAQDEVEALSNQQKICAICQDEIASDCRKTLCNHFYCSACLKQWLDKHKTCPVCLTDLEEKLASVATQ
jgi:hypothetical protein